jgi:hypothetical protein
LSFLQEHKEQTVHLAIDNIEDLKKNTLLQTIHKAYPELKFTLLVPDRGEFLTIAKENGIPFWTNTYVKDWDTFIYLIDSGVCAVTVVEEMGFQLDKIAAVAHAANVEVHVIVNYAQSSVETTPALKKFFIRPEDIDVYTPYIDVCDIKGDSRRVSVYYNVYANDKQWFGKLNELINSLNSDIDNRCIPINFAEARIKCNKRCLKGGSCRLCDNYEKLAKTLSERNIIIKQPKS